MPWHLPADLKHFKTITMGKPIIMGRKTFEAIGRPLPGRRNIVVSRQVGLSFVGCEVCRSLEDAFATCAIEEEVMVIGGAEIYQQALPLVSRMVLTLIDHDFEGDAFFPQWNVNEWHEVSCEKHQPDEKNLYSYRFVELRRKTGVKS